MSAVMGMVSIDLWRWWRRCGGGGGAEMRWWQVDFPSTMAEHTRRLLGVSGGSASGKTTVCYMIIQQLHNHRVVLVNQVREWSVFERRDEKR
ncbi:putative transferase [Helianthus anomalus]